MRSTYVNIFKANSIKDSLNELADKNRTMSFEICVRFILFLKAKAIQYLQTRPEQTPK